MVIKAGGPVHTSLPGRLSRVGQPFIYLSIYLFVYPSRCLSIYQPVLIKADGPVHTSLPGRLSRVGQLWTPKNQINVEIKYVL